jgi:hypothetical protein
MQPRATKDDYRQALDGLVYPVSTDNVLRTARDHGGIDSEVASILEQIPERSFDSSDELKDAIRAAYAAAGAFGESVPV